MVAFGSILEAFKAACEAEGLKADLIETGHDNYPIMLVRGLSQRGNGPIKCALGNNNLSKEEYDTVQLGVLSALVAVAAKAGITTPKML